MKNIHKTMLLSGLVILTTMGTAMGLFDFAKVCLFSEVNAVVTLDGKPVAGVEVIRTAKWASKDNQVFTDKTTTDEQGRFHFDPLYSNSLSKFTASTPVIGQKLVFIYKGKEYLGWEASRRNYDLNGELDNNMAVNLSCDISQPVSIKDQVKRLPINGICDWKR